MSDDKLKLIQDIELDNLNDENDFLETRKYSDTLQEIIKHTQTPCTIGLFGEWGSGKSSIIRDVINKLDYNKSKQYYNNTGEKIRFIVYDAWKYSKDSFRRTFLLEMAKELKFQEQDYFDMFYTNKSNEKINRSLNATNILTEIATSAINEGFNFNNIFKNQKTINQIPFIFAPEQFERIFNNMHFAVLKKYDVDNEPFPSILHETNIDKLVIVIDNLDRCDADTVCEMLSDIKGFLNKDKVVFIVPLDDKMLKKHLEKINGYDDSESSEYLRKIFDCVLSLKKTQEFDMYEVLTKLLNKHNIKYKPDTIGIVSEEYASNPRRIIKFINNFEIEKKLLLCKSGVDEEFIKTNETLIAFLLILKEEQYSLYQKILEKTSNIYTILNHEAIKNIYMQMFLNNTEFIWNKADLNVVDKVIYNSNEENKFLHILYQALEENKFDKINQEEYIGVPKYLVLCFNKWCKRKAYTTIALNFFKQLIRISTYKIFNRSHFGYIYNKNRKDLKILLEYLENKEDIKYVMRFIKSSISYSYNDLYDFYIKKLKDNYSVIDVAKKEYSQGETTNMLAKYGEMKNIYKVGFEYFLNYQMYNQEDLEIYQEYFYTHSYFNNYKPYLNLNDKVLKLIINESIIDKLLQIKFKNGSDLHKLMQKLLDIEVINHSQYCKGIFNIEDVDGCVKLSMFMDFVEHNQSKNITLDGYTHLCISCIENCKEFSDKVMLDFFVKHFNEDENVNYIVRKMVELKQKIEDKYDLMLNILNNFKVLNFNTYAYFNNMIKDYTDDLKCIEVLFLIYEKAHPKIFNQGLIKDFISYWLSDIFMDVNSIKSKNLQLLFVKCAKSDNQELSTLVINIVKEYKKQIYSIPPMNNELQEMRNKYAKLTPEFKETFFKGEAL